MPAPPRARCVQSLGMKGGVCLARGLSMKGGVSLASVYKLTYQWACPTARLDDGTSSSNSLNTEETRVVSAVTWQALRVPHV